MRAQALLASGRLDEAVALLRREVERRPQDPDARLLLGSALALVPRRAEALEQIRLAIAARPGHAGGHFALGLALARFVELDGARQAFQQAVALDPAHAPAHVNLALVLAQTGEKDAALRHLSRAIAIEGDVVSAAHAHHLSGLIHAERDQIEEAAAAFAKAVSLRPDHAEAQLHLGLARRQLLDDAGALAALREAARLSPQNARTRYELGRELLRAGQAREAVEHLRAASTARPDDQASLYSLARALQASGDPAAAAAAIEAIRTVRGRTERADRHAFEASRLNNEGVALEREGDLAAAQRKYAAALELDPLNTVFRRNLGLAWCRSGRWRDGAQELREVLRLDPNDAEAAKALVLAEEREDQGP
jgi:tetratricopeptide (TPR) repeat protein